MSDLQGLDLNRVAVFLKVVEEAGFTKAAQALGLPKSSVSRSVALLEQDLRVSLLRRTSRSVTPTEAGTAFYERAARGLALLGEAREAVMELNTELRGPIRITSSVDMAVWRLAPVVAEFVGRHPGVFIDVLLSGRNIDLFEEGVDFAVRVGPLRDERLVARKLPPAEFALYASPAYLQRHGTPQSVAELAQHRCVLFRAGDGRATWALRTVEGIEETVQVRGAIHLEDFSFATQTVMAGAGIGLLPAFVAQEAAGERLTRVLPHHYWSGGPVHLLYPVQRYMPRRCVAFRDFLIERAAGWSSLETH